jgi:hypothetical protein
LFHFPFLSSFSYPSFFSFIRPFYYLFILNYTSPHCCSLFATQAAPQIYQLTVREKIHPFETTLLSTVAQPRHGLFGRQVSIPIDIVRVTDSSTMWPVGVNDHSLTSIVPFLL